MNNGNGTAKAARRPTAEDQAKAYRGAVEVILAQSNYLVSRIGRKIKTADWDDAQSAARALAGYATDLNRMVARVRGKGSAP